ncbi:MAG: diguanylate cyclase, partial [Pseudomonadota bacterium]|nr:diguanylate cyclase [Pseudomonadota bacterium]
MTSSRAAAAHAIPLRPYPLGRVVAAAALLILFLIGVTAAVLLVSYEDTVRQQKTTLRNLAIAFSAQTFNVAQAIDSAMGQAEREFAAQRGQPVRRGAPAAPMALIDVGEDSLGQQLLRIDLYDGAGTLLASAVPPGVVAAPLSAPALRAVLGAPAQRLHIRISDIDRPGGRGTLVFARALHERVGGRGGRGGSVVAQVDPAGFHRLYGMVELGKGGSITLFNRDGTMLVRGPNFSAGIGRSFAATPLFTRYLPAGARGVAAEPSPLDGQLRLYGYDTVGGFPLVVVTAIDRADALTDWYGRLWMAVASLLLIALTVSFLAWRVRRDAGRQARLIGELAASEARAGNSAAYLAAILNAVGTPIWVLDNARRIVMHNDAFSRFVGRGAAELVGCDEAAAFDPAGAAARARRYQQVSHGAEPREAIAAMVDGAGAPRTVIQLSSKLLDAGGQAQIVSVLTDITERQNAERRLSDIANFDQLTGLPNQGRFRRLLEAEVASAAASGASIGMLAVSLERVQEISDLLGHEAGDSALRQIGAVFAALLPQAKAVARIKGNEFAVLVEADEGRAGLAAYAAALQQRLAGALLVGGREFYLGPLIGVAMYP